MKKIGGFQFLLGVLIGAVMFGGTVAYAAGIMAQPKTAAIIIDGTAVDLKGYLIEDAHYFQLRDLSEYLAAGDKDFSIVWDGENNRVLIDTSRSYDANERYAPASASEPIVTTETPAMSIEEMKAEVVRLTNVERFKAGLPELIVLPELMDCAQAKAQDFKDSHYYGHNSPVYGTPLEMVLSLGISATGCSENAAPGRDTPAEVMADWMESDVHRANILNAKRTHIGVGIIPTADGMSYMWAVQMITMK